MPFSAKATLVGFAADPERYPCHAMLKVGDEVIFNGEEIKGKMCSDVMTRIADALYKLYVYGPRYVAPEHYQLFWYSANSIYDADKKKFDGNGWKPINREYEEPPHHVRCLQPPEAFHWPPLEGTPVMREFTFTCPDGRTAAVFKVEAFDLATAGHALPYTRREITIMDRVAKAGGTYEIEKILNLYTEEELLDVYPPFTKALLYPFVEELKALEYATEEDGKLTITQKGIDRVARYKTEIPAEDAQAMKL